MLSCSSFTTKKNRESFSFPKESFLKKVILVLNVSSDSLYTKVYLNIYYLPFPYFTKKETFFLKKKKLIYISIFLPFYMFILCFFAATNAIKSLYTLSSNTYTTQPNRRHLMYTLVLRCASNSILLGLIHFFNSIIQHITLLD